MQTIEIQVGVIAECGTPDTYWCEGHIPRAEFVEAVEGAESVIGLRVCVPTHAVIYHGWQAEYLRGEWTVFDRRDSEFDGSRPVTWVFWDEVDEAS